jgi:tRNA1Val (adenine37-N6)-methyltransferase
MAHNNYFQFKQFRIDQQRAAMRVNTDGVVLGAWCRAGAAAQILDIGTGTGLIALMLAQRNPQSQITAIDIDEGAWLDASHNFQQSAWGNRLFAKHVSLQDFAENPGSPRFDHIVCNPPFFRSAVKAADQRRNMARHTDHLSFEELLEYTAKLLNQNGLFSVIVPAEAEKLFIELASGNRLFPGRITRVRHNCNKPVVRVLIELGPDEKVADEKCLIIETLQRHRYTDEFQSLVNGFYLK